MSENPAPSKVCVVCKVDLAGKPRTKDAKGRYFCPACLTRAKQAAAAKRARVATPVVASVRDADEPDLSLIREDPAGPVVFRQQAVCPKCETPVVGAAAICTNCGFNRATGASVVTAVAGKGPGIREETTVILKKDGSCGKCGYDLRRGKSMRCPECGTVNRVSGKKDQYAEDSRRVARMAYIKPAAIFLVSVPITAGILTGVLHLGPAQLAGAAMLLGAAYLVELVIYFLCTITFVGVDEPFHLMALRLLAVCGLTNVAWALVDPVPVFIVKFGVPALTHVLSLMALMEIDYEDAWIVALLTLLGWFGVLLTIVYMLPPQ